MSKLFSIFILILTAGIINAQEKTRSYDYKDFSEVAVGSGMKVTITQSDDYNIQIKADEDDFDDIEVEKKGNKLRIYIDSWGFFRSRSNIYVNIKMPVLNDLDLSGGTKAKVKMDNSGKKFAADLSGGSEMNGELTCGDIEIDLSGGSRMNLTGSGNNLDANGSGGSIFKLKDFSVKNISCNLSGGSQATVNIDGSLESNQSGGSRLVYYGNAKSVNTNSSGGSSISRGD